MFNILNVTNTIHLLLQALKVVENLIGKKLIIVDKNDYDNYQDLNKIDLLEALDNKIKGA